MSHRQKVRARKLYQRLDRLVNDPRTVKREFREIDVYLHPNLRKAIVVGPWVNRMGLRYRLVDPSRLPPPPQLHPLG